MSVRNMIPNMLTLGNLACGLVAIVVLMDDQGAPPSYKAIGWLMLGAMTFDFFDGFVARLLKATSPLGKELDSLSDVVSFGVLPGLMVYQMLDMQLPPMADIYIEGAGTMTLDEINALVNPWWMRSLPFVGLLIPLFSAYRLAKFNIDTRQSYGFLGLPTPANALFFLSIFLICMEEVAIDHAIPRRYYSYSDFQFTGFSVYVDFFSSLYNPWVLIGLTMLFSILLVTEIPLLALKFKDYSLKNNWPRYGLMVLSVILLAVLWFRAIPLIIVLYFVVSFIDRFISQKT
jgi:CDP-diacylglycerol---serine O-phosphatidyltransferase